MRMTRVTPIFERDDDGTTQPVAGRVPESRRTPKAEGKLRVKELRATLYPNEARQAG